MKERIYEFDENHNLMVPSELNNDEQKELVKRAVQSKKKIDDKFNLSSKLIMLAGLTIAVIASILKLT